MLKISSPNNMRKKIQRTVLQTPRLMCIETHKKLQWHIHQPIHCLYQKGIGVQWRSRSEIVGTPNQVIDSFEQRSNKTPKMTWRKWHPGLVPSYPKFMAHDNPINNWDNPLCYSKSYKFWPLLTWVVKRVDWCTPWSVLGQGFWAFTLDCTWMIRMIRPLFEWIRS